MTKIVAISDLHGHLPEIPKCELLLIAGDICPTINHHPIFQREWLESVFEPWVASLGVAEVVCVAGNHDWIFAEGYRPKNGVYIYLQDEYYITRSNWKIWASPWQKIFHNWAFNLEEEQLAEMWKLIQTDTDILLLHGPPYGYGDIVYRSTIVDEEAWPIQFIDHVGSESLRDKILEIQPKLVAFGHIHSGYGTYKLGESTLFNCSLLDESYRLRNKPWEIEL